MSRVGRRMTDVALGLAAVFRGREVRGICLQEQPIGRGELRRVVADEFVENYQPRK
jgi:hypothetical protein